jgi:serine phosphatase RsbU (regulator of sigma subunit)/tetratricopeptide (TPR) repeat protein
MNSFKPFFLLLLVSLCAEAQNTDSLIANLNKSESDTHRIFVMNILSKSFPKEKEKSRAYADSALRLSAKVSDLRYKGIANKCLADWFMQRTMLDSAEFYYNIGLKYYQQANDNKGISNLYYSLGNALSINEKHEAALVSYQNALKYAELANSDGLRAYALNGIGTLYSDMKNYKDALELHFKAKSLAMKAGDDKLLGWTYSCIGNIYIKQKSYDEAIENFELSKKHYGRIKFLRGLFGAMNNIAVGYSYKGMFAESIGIYKKVAEIKDSIGDRNGASIALQNIASTYTLLKDYDRAMEYANKALELANATGLKQSISESYGVISQIYVDKGDYKNAYEYYVKYKQLQDSVFSEKSQNMVTEMQKKYESDNQKQQIALLEKDKETQRLWTYTLSIGLGIIFLLAIWAVAQYRVKNKANKLLEKQNIQIAHQKKEITDSINYAKRIQSSILPRSEDMSAIFPESFILYKPKDIVSGDFYWFQRKPNEFLIAAADCTGHGVPGALMSMVGVEKLEALSPLYTEPSQILEGLNREVKNALRQSASDESTRDGMDIALVILDLKTKILQFAGANRPIWIVRGSGFNVKNNPERGTQNFELIELKATKAAIGGLTTSEQKFPDTQFALREGDILYMFTDGYADQFGGPEGKKMMTKNFRDFLLSVTGKPMQDQQSLLDKHFEDWRGSYEQVDDILVIGIRI